MKQQKSPAELWQAVNRLLCRKRPMSILPEVQAAIEACQTMEELKDLLFSLQNKNEATIRAFDRKMDQLDGTE